MRSFLNSIACVFFIFLNHASVLSSNDKNDPTGISKVGSHFSLNQFAFTENKGQIKDNKGQSVKDVKFAFQQDNIQIFLLEQGLAFQFSKTNYPDAYKNLIHSRKAEDIQKLQEQQKKILTETFRMDMVLVGANKKARITTDSKREDYVNYYNYNVFDVHSFSRITYHEIYPGIDWIIYAKDGKLKYDFLVKPNADPNLIKWEYKDHETLVQNPDGSMTLGNRFGSINEKRPESFQGDNFIATQFKVEKNMVSFNLGEYNKSQELVIDPAVIWATYYGNTGYDDFPFCETDGAGNVYLGGVTNSTTGIASGGFQSTYGGAAMDGFLVKFNSSGSRLWATYYGGPDDDYAYSCETDASGNVYLCGHTQSTVNIASGGHQNVPANNYGFSKAFLVKFDGAGSRQWATYYSGNGSEVGFCCATDASGNVFLGGLSSSNTGTFIASGGFQNTQGGFQDAFLVKFNSSGVRQWGTYYGSVDWEEGVDCFADGSGNVYLAGSVSNSFSLVTTSTAVASGGHQNTFGGGIQDGFLVKFNSGGSRLWATYYGGAGSDYLQSGTVDNSGNVFIAGTTESTANIASGGHQNTYAGGSNDGYLVKFNSSGVRQWATYYGGSLGENVYACAVNNAGEVYLGGLSLSTNNIASPGYPTGPGFDAFLAKFDAAGIRVWGYPFGDPVNGEQIRSIATDPSSQVYIAGTSGTIANLVFNGFQSTYYGGGDVFLMKLCDTPPQPTAITGNTLACAGSAKIYSIAPVAGALTYSWTNTAGWTGSVSANNFTANVYSNGTVNVSASNTCGAGPAQTIAVVVIPLPTVSAISGSVCSGKTFTINPTGANTYSYSGGSATVSPSTTTTYSISGTSTAGCVSAASAVVTVTVSPSPTISVNSGSLCTGQSFTLLPSGASGFVYSSTTAVVSPTITTSYSVTGTGTNGCISSNTAVSTVTVHARPTVSVNSGTICLGSTFTIIPTGASTYNFLNGSATVTPAGLTSYSVTGTSTAGCLSTNTAVSTVTVFALPAVTVNSGTLCTGNIFTIVPNGAASYVYSSGSATVNPLVNTTYSVTGTSSLGCVSATPAVSSITVFITPTVSVNSGTICSGQVFTMVPTGAATYVFSSGSSTVNPLSNAAYSVTGTSTAGCVASTSAVANITVHPVPIITVNSGSICAGQSFTIVPNGAVTYSVTNNNFTVSPTTNSTYSVTGTNSLGCVSPGSAISAVSVYAVPIIVINSGTICAGDVFTMTPSGAGTFTFSSGTSTVNPLSTTVYSVTGTSTAGCISTVQGLATVAVNPLPTITANSGSICAGQTFVIIPGGANTYSVSGGTNSVSPVLNTSYTVTGTSLFGCKSSSAAISSVTVFALPTLTLSTSIQTICVGESAILTVSGANSYSWTHGPTGSSLIVSPAVNSNYTAIGTSMLGCSNTASIMQVVDECTFVKDISNSGRFLVYPNPNSGEFYVEISVSTNARMINTLGQVIRELSLNPGINRVELNNEANGIYFLCVEKQSPVKVIKR